MRRQLLLDAATATVEPCDPVRDSCRVSIRTPLCQLLFEHARDLRTRDDGPVGGFGVAGADEVYHWVEGEIRGASVVLRHPDGVPIRHVRHAWSDHPVRANLVNGDGLPAEPFRWDAE